MLPEEWKYQVAGLGDKWWINMVGSISTQIRFQSSGHFRPALLGSSWSVQRLGSQDVLAQLESCFEAKFQVVGKDPHRVMAKTIRCETSWTQWASTNKRAQRDQIPVSEWCFLQLPRTLTSVVVWIFVFVMMSYLIWHLWNGQRAKYSGEGWQPSSSDWSATSFPSRLGFCGWLWLVTQKLGAAISLHHWSV